MRSQLWMILGCLMVFTIDLDAIKLQNSSSIGTALPRIAEESDAKEIDPASDPDKSPAEAVKRIKGTIGWVVKQSLPYLLKVSSEVGISANCSASLLQVVSGLKNMKDWAGKMVDSSSKIPSGILEGTIAGLGSYDECVDIVVTDERYQTAEEKFRGKYCLLELRPPRSLQKPMSELENTTSLRDYKHSFLKMFSDRKGYGEIFKLLLSVCIPSTCMEEDLSKLADYATKPLGFRAVLNSCQVKETPKLASYQVAIICVLSPIAVLVILGTITEAVIGLMHPEGSPYTSKPKAFLIRLLIAFSIYSNTKKFLDVKRQNNKLGMLAGVRVFSITWIILGHSYYFPHVLHYAKFKDFFTVTETQYDFPFMVIQNTALAVDTFFLVTGFLTTYISWKKMTSSNGRLNAVAFFMKRIMRMLPAQFLTMGIMMLLPLFGSGPLWEQTWKQPVENCKKYWWSNALFIQNLWDYDNMCLFQTWFLAISMQLHIITFFILIIMFRWPIFGILINVVLMVAGGVVVALITLYKNLPPTFSIHTDDFPGFYDFYCYVYVQIYSHFGPYCLGILLGYYVNKRPNGVQKPVVRVFLWFLAVACGLMSVYGLYAFVGGSWHNMHPAAHTTYAGTHRTLWAIGVSWVLYACVTNRGGIVNAILSWTPLAVLDRLTFLSYLFHPLVMYYFQARLRETINTDYLDMIYYFISTTVITYMIAFIFHVTIEQPVNFFDSLIFGAPRAKPEEENENKEEKTMKEILTENRKTTFGPMMLANSLKTFDS